MNNLLDLTYINKLYSYLSDISKNKQTYNIEILEPMYTILKLVLLSLKPVGTKIAIYNNNISIQEPNVLQPINRWYYTSSREDLQYLLKPILRSLINYEPFKNKDYILLFENAILGLEKLKKSYFNIACNTCYTLDLYIGIIKKNLEDGSIMIEETYQENLEMSIKSKEKFKQIFKSIWDEKELKLIVDMIEITINSNTDFLSSLENILKEKEKLIKNIINNTAQLM